MERLRIVRTHLFVLILLCYCAGNLPAQAEIQDGKVVTRNVLFVLDCSMQPGGKIDPVGELRVAKEVIAAEHILSKIPPSAKVGLRVFGNRYSGFDADCQQSDLVVPIAAGNRRTIGEYIRVLKPKGLSPLTYALMQSENDLRYLDGDNELYLFTGGNDTCGGDPCAYIARMHSLGIKFKVNVYYFESANSEGREASMFIAAKSGGKWTEANSNEELKSLFENAPILHMTAKAARKSARRYLNQPNPLQFKVPYGTVPANDGGGVEFGISIPRGKVGPYIPLDQ